MDRDQVAVDCSALRQPDLATVEALLRLRLLLRRRGEDLVLQNSGQRLRELIGLLGLDDVLRSAPSVQPGWKAEEGE